MTQTVPKSPDAPVDGSPASNLDRPGKTRRSRILPIGLGLAIAGAAAGIWYFLSRPVDAALHVSGRIEGYETDVGAKVGGRVKAVTVREGDQVRQGQLLAQLDDDEIQAQLQGANARIVTAQQQARQAAFQVDAIDSQIREAQLNVVQSQQDTQGRVYQAESNMAALDAQLKQAESQLNLAKVNRDRYQQLWQQGATSRLQYDQAQTTYETALAAVESARRQVEAARGGLALAQTSSLNPAIRGTQVSALLEQRKRGIAQVQAALADVKNAQAAQKQIQAQLAYLNVASPINGIVTARTVEPGAVVGNGKTLLSLLDLNSVYFRGFVPEGEIGRVRVGQPAKVFLDSNPDQPLSARVAVIDPQASFTPENVYFKNDRVRQVVGVKLTLESPAGYAKPGMPADAEIDVK